MGIRLWGTAKVISAALLILLGGHTPAQSQVPKQSWKDVSMYPSRGLTPLYTEAGRACQRILVSKQRWTVLPRPIDTVHARPDQPPCFEMHDGDTYCNDRFGNAQAIRWATEQTWDGQFRLLYNTTLRARHDDELWLEIDGYQRDLKSKFGSKWNTYRPLVGRSFFFRSKFHLARASKAKWWLASKSGLYLLENGTLKREEIPGWPSGATAGVVSDHRGRTVAWSDPSTDGGAKAAFFDGKHWATADVASHRWTHAALRADGSAVLAGRSRVMVVKPPSSKVDDKPEDAEHIQAGHFWLGDDWVRPTGSLAVSPNGSFLFSAMRLSDHKPGLVRELGDGRRDWIDFSELRRLQILATPEDGFFILSQSGKAYTLAPDSKKLSERSQVGDFRYGDRLLGCDHQSRIYVQRGSAILVFVPDHPALPMDEARVLSLVKRGGTTKLSAATDTKGKVWYVDPDGIVFTFSPTAKVPFPADDRLSDGEALWPGVDGSMLILRKEGRLALAHGDRHLELADSIGELAEAAWDELLAATPRSTYDLRVDLRPRTRVGQSGPLWLRPPWLRIGKSLFYSDGKQVTRIRAREKASPEGRVEVQTISLGDFNLLGPLGGGQLLLAKINGGSISKVTSWYTLNEPEGGSELEPVASPPEKQNGGSLTRPASCAGPWLVDRQGYLWLHQGFDRCYRIDSTDKWQMLKDFGRPQVEHPSGIVWARHTARVFEGYEVAGADGFRRSCRPTYMEHLTPFASHNDGVLCLTPQGIAQLRFDKNDPDRDAVVQSRRVHWDGTPVQYVGMSDKHLMMLVKKDSVTHLVRVLLPQ